MHQPLSLNGIFGLIFVEFPTIGFDFSAIYFHFGVYYTKRVVSVEMCRGLFSPIFLICVCYPRASKAKEVVIMLGARIAALRREKGLSQAQLAERLKISPSAMGMYEQGRREPSMDTVVALAREFGVSTDYLLTGVIRTSEQETLDEMLLRRIQAADRRMELRNERPFSRQELAVLFAAMLMEER